MDEVTYKVWCPLHIRTAKGETLNAEEQAIFEAGCRALDAEERLDGRLEELKQARQRAEELEAERTQLQARYEALRAEIMEFETNLSELIRQNWKILSKRCAPKKTTHIMKTPNKTGSFYLGERVAKHLQIRSVNSNMSGYDVSLQPSRQSEAYVRGSTRQKFTLFDIELPQLEVCLTTLEFRSTRFSPIGA